ncbi:MAG TPA: hypothetical protein VFU06_04400 [Longimicrobiales bacterium]|nr:hypothetical protein [Longimicrobiales bacterium]
MAQSSPKLVELARRIVEQEAGGSSDPAASAAAVDSACRRVQDHLVDLLGSGGVDALIGRALHIAQREQPLLAGASVSGQPGTCFNGLAESFAAATEEEARSAATTVLTCLLDLLVMLLGEELGMKPVRRLWPRAIRAVETHE